MAIKSPIDAGTYYCNFCGHDHYYGVVCSKRTAEVKNEDVVNNPKHYQLEGLDVEALDIIKSSLTLEEYIGYLKGNIGKYWLRHKKKNGKEDVEKMIYYMKELDKYI